MDNRQEERNRKSSGYHELETPLLYLWTVLARFVKHHEHIDANGNEDDEWIERDGTRIGVLRQEDEFTCYPEEESSGGSCDERSGNPTDEDFSDLHPID